MNRRQKLIMVVIAAVFIMIVIAPLMAQQTQTNVRNDSTGTGSCGGTYYGKDVFGTIVVVYTFYAAWGFSWSNGSLVKEYTPISKPHATVPFVSWIHVHTPIWTNLSHNKYAAVGNIGYHVGLWELSYTQHSYIAVVVQPNSYGSGELCYGNGEIN